MLAPGSIKIVFFRRVALTAGLILTGLVAATAEQLPIKTYTTADGLARDQINRIVQDSHGFLWFCTAEGLSRFDAATGHPNCLVATIVGRSAAALLRHRLRRKRVEPPVRSEAVSVRSEAVPMVAGDAAPEAGFDFSAVLTYVGGDRELLDELLGIFVEDAPIRMEAIRRAIAGREAAELTREAHTIKGALKVIGATTAAGLAQGLEALARDGNMSEADKLAVALEREMDRLLQSLMASKRG